MKETGNRLYLEGNNSEAAAKYSEGLDVCPLCFKEDRAMLYANRAAVLIRTVKCRRFSFFADFLSENNEGNVYFVKLMSIFILISKQDILAVIFC